MSWAGSGWVGALTVLAALSAGAAGAAAPVPAAPVPAAPAGTSANPADAYPVRLARPFRAGDKFAFTADATVVQTMTANMSGQTRTLQPRSLSVHFEGTEQVLAVTARGEPTRAAYTVTECVAREGKKQTAIVAPGRVVTVEAGKWRSRVDVDEGAFTIQDDLLVRAVLSLPNLADPADDECFGTDRPQKVGATWPVRPDPLVKAFAAAGTKVKPQDVSGTMKLAAVETADGVPCVRVQGKVRLEHFFPPATDLPNGAKVQDSTYEYKFTRLLPLDPAGQCVTDSHSTNLLLKLRTDDASIGPDVLVDGKLLRTVGIKRRPVK